MDKEKKVAGLTQAEWDDIYKKAKEGAFLYKFIILYPGSSLKSVCKNRPTNEELLRTGGTCYEAEEYFRLLREAHKIPDNVVIGVFARSPTEEKIALVTSGF